MEAEAQSDAPSYFLLAHRGHNPGSFSGHVAPGRLGGAAAAAHSALAGHHPTLLHLSHWVPVPVPLPDYETASISSW